MTVTVNSTECGYQNTPAPTQAPTLPRNIQFSTTNTQLWYGDPEIISAILTGWEPNRSYDLQQVFFKEDNLFVIIVNTVQN